MPRIRRSLEKDKWCEVILTEHALQRLQETSFSLDDALECFQNSCREELSREDREGKARKYGEDAQENISFWRYGSVLFIVKETEDALVLLSIYDQQIGAGFYRRFRRNTDGKRYHPTGKRFEPEERTKPPWR